MCVPWRRLTLGCWPNRRTGGSAPAGPAPVSPGCHLWGPADVDGESCPGEGPGPRLQPWQGCSQATAQPPETENAAADRRQWPPSLSGTAPPPGRDPGLLTQPHDVPPASLARSHRVSPRPLCSRLLPWAPLPSSTTLPPHEAKAQVTFPRPLLCSNPSLAHLYSSRWPPKILLLTLPCSILTSAMLPFLESCVPFLLLRTQLPCLLLQEAGTCP